jgi:hypothetical protein
MRFGKKIDHDHNNYETRNQNRKINLFRILVGNHIKDIIPSRSLSGNSNMQSTMSVVSIISLLGSYLWVSRNAEVKLVKCLLKSKYIRLSISSNVVVTITFCFILSCVRDY